jgi:signal recognition particle subunit SRP54
MVLDTLSESLRSSLDKIRGKRRVDKEDVENVVKEVQRSLLQSDVSITVVETLSDNIESRALDEEPPGGVSAREHILNIVYDELVGVIGDEMEISLQKDQVILLAGLQGAGKTTTAAKMAWWFSKKGLRPAVIQTDTFRPGAYEQTKQLTDEAEVDFYGDPDANTPTEIVENGLAETEDADIHIIDTEGRHALEEELITELKNVHQVAEPTHTLLVIDAATGSNVEKQARTFEESVGVDGITISKMDGTAKGGGALTAVEKTDSNLAFIGTGEEVHDIERFETESFVSRLLGMGDLTQLKERIQRVEEENDEDWEPEDALKGDFTLVDMKNQLRSMNSMGPLEEVIDMIPGMGGNIKSQVDTSELQVKQEQFREFEIIMDSMNQEELENPGIIDNSRKKRIARGSGKSKKKVNELLAQYKKMNNMFGKFGGEKDIEQMTTRMQNGRFSF